MIRSGICALACLVPAPVLACRLALVLALDVSSSVDAAEDALQRGGVAAALRAPEVRMAFFEVDAPVALAVFEWSGRDRQTLILDWAVMDSAAALDAAAKQIAASERGYREFPTAIGWAMNYAAALLAGAPDCVQQTVDVAGDGSNNEGPKPREIYATQDWDGVTVNGLVVNAAEFESEAQLIRFYRSEVLRGPGAFLEVAQGFDDYERAMRRKLVREVRPLKLGHNDVRHTGQPG